ncbi:unnamed protein product, partial [Strongylus vulgaris]
PATEEDLGIQGAFTGIAARETHGTTERKLSEGVKHMVACNLKALRRQQ